MQMPLFGSSRTDTHSVYVYVRTIILRTLRNVTVRGTDAFTEITNAAAIDCKGHVQTGLIKARNSAHDFSVKLSP